MQLSVVVDFAIALREAKHAHVGNLGSVSDLFFAIAVVRIHICALILGFMRLVMQEHVLTDAFREFGTILSVKVVKEKGGKLQQILPSALLPRLSTSTFAPDLM